MGYIGQQKRPESHLPKEKDRNVNTEVAKEKAFRGLSLFYIGQKRICQTPFPPTPHKKRFSLFQGKTVAKGSLSSRKRIGIKLWERAYRGKVKTPHVPFL